MSTSKDILFTPTSLGALKLPNRFVMAPLTRSRAGSDMVPSPFAKTYYQQRAEAGLIIAEATNISPQARGYAFTPGIFTDAQEAGWREITDTVHQAGGRIVLQLWHVGRISHPSLQPEGQLPVAPSAVAPSGPTSTESGMQDMVTPRALRTDEIPGIIEDYRNAAARARRAGFDGVEVHSANCYLLDQFLRDTTNQRTDQYGGSVENRTRLTLEATQAVIDEWGADRVGIRLSPVTRAIGQTPTDSHPVETYGYLVDRLSDMKLAYLHCVEGQTRGSRTEDGFDFVSLRRRFSGSYIANNGYSFEDAAAILNDGTADAVAFGRPFIGNPDLVERARIGAPLVDAPESSYYMGGAEGYIDFPKLSG